MKLIKKILMILCLLSLIGCSTKLVQTEYITLQIPDPPAPPEYYHVQWYKIDGNYCVTAESAKNLLKNRELDISYQMEMEKILRGLKDDYQRDRRSDN